MLFRNTTDTAFGDKHMVVKTKQVTEKADLVVDSLGKRCPMPILDLRDSLDKIKVGQVVELLSDDAGSKTDVPAFCRRTGHQLQKAWEDNGAFHYLVKKGK
jgi:tRNA 2-thiouridine synthesizing protein A